MLAPGARIGSFEVIAPLGAGGMGEVYRARDPRLGREVAIKVLPAERVTAEDRRRRFVQEAKAASALNHPNIVTIHEIGFSDGIDFIVMEYVPGQTLSGLVPKSGMPVREVLRLAIPIADALAAAHARGIVHRDIKPANLVVTPEGVVKVLDFGLAKLVAEVTDEQGELTTATEGPRTLPGAITGTPAYMSPEQATGGKADARSDIFAFGVVLYEMVTGRRPFAGKSASETRAAVVTGQPRTPRELVPGIPEGLERIILRCLRKEPDRRFQHMVDVKVELQELKEESDSRASAPAGTAPVRRRSLRRWIAAVAAGFVILLVAAAGWLWRSRRPVLPAPTVVQLTSERYAGAGSFSPDGTQIAYSSAGEDGKNWDIWLKIVGETESRRLTTDPASESYPAWSPDGTEIAFLRYESIAHYFGTGTVHLVSPLGGRARRLSDFPARLQLSWSPDGRWLAASRAQSGNDPPGGIYLISVATGELRALTLPMNTSFDHSPSFSPGGRALAYCSCFGAAGRPGCDVDLLALDQELRPQGTPRPLVHEANELFGGVAWTRDGRSIVYHAGNQLWRVPADGSAPPQVIGLAGRGNAPSTVSSQDRLAFVQSNGDWDIYRLRLGGPPTLLVGSSFADTQAQWSPDGRRIVFASARAGGKNEIWLADADGSNPTRLTRGPGRAQGSPGWSPDGRSIAFDSQDESSQIDVWMIGADGMGLRRITHGPANHVVPSLSRDGRFIYFAADGTGRFEIWRVATGGGAEEQVTREGGAAPIESLDGRTLYYMRHLGVGPLLARPIAGGEERTILTCVGTFGYAVTARGLFYVACDTPGAAPSPERKLRFWEAATGQDRPIANLQVGEYAMGLSVSPDGQSIIYGRGSLTSDLMMIENFR